jgi:CRP-like cAMP-binding protein
MPVWKLTANRILLDRLSLHTTFSLADERVVEDLSFRETKLEKGRDIIRQGDSPTEAVLIISGVVARYKDLSEGGRAYLGFHFRGDLPDAQAMFAERIDHSICTVSDAIIATVTHRILKEVFASNLHVGFAVWRETLIDAAITRQSLFNISAQSTTPRLAHFLCEYFYRAKSADLGKGHSVEFPLSQQQLGDALGMSLVTCNRALQSLRRSGAIQWTDGLLTVTDRALLAKIGNFDKAYLELCRKK